MRKFVALALIVSGLLLAGTAAVGLADTALPNIPPHRHFILGPNGIQREVGPRVCDDPSLQPAFNQFHSNVHRAVAGSEGPDQSAPGLHNGFGAELIATSTC